MASPSEMLDLLSEQILPREVRPRLKLLFALSDELLFLDRTDELAVDRSTLIRIASDETLVPGNLRDVVIVETAKHLGRRIKAKRPDSRRLTWEDAAKYGLPVQPGSEAELRSTGILEAATIEQLDEALRARFPTIPEFWTETDRAQLQDAVSRNFLVNQTVWDCLVRNLGWWAALVVIGSALIFAALVLEIGWQAALAVAIVYSGFVTAYFIFQCIANTSYSAF